VYNIKKLFDDNDDNSIKINILTEIIKY